MKGEADHKSAVPLLGRGGFRSAPAPWLATLRKRSGRTREPAGVVEGRAPQRAVNETRSTPALPLAGSNA
jgi:hypothetical protein